jgi:outer membrane scaffolding protein for murein synthesis (MipA/OmpV family)
MNYRSAVAALAILGLAATSATAQARGPELTVGLASIGMETYDGEANYTQLYVPSGMLRLAFYLSPKVAIEPTLSLNVWSGEGDSFRSIGIGAFVPYYFNGDQGMTGFYVAPGLGILSYGDEDGSRGSQIWFAAEGGKKFKLSDSAFLRLAAQYYMESEDEDNGLDKYTNLGVILGLSLFLK